MTLTLVPSISPAGSSAVAPAARVSVPSTRFAIAAPPELAAASAEAAALALAGDDVALAELRAHTGLLAHRYIDAVTDGFLLTLARAVRGVPGAGARTAGVVRGFADRFVTPGVRHARREQIDDFVGFLRAHVIDLDDTRAAIGFAIDEDLAAALAPALAAGDGVDADVLHRALHATIDACMHHFLDAPLSMLHLGLIARAAIAVGRSGVTTRAHGLVDDVLGRRDAAAIARLIAFLAGGVALTARGA